MDQYVDDHQQYRKSYLDCVAWLHAVNEKLSEWGDTTGDKDSIQAQLDKLQASGIRYYAMNFLSKDNTRTSI